MSDAVKCMMASCMLLKPRAVGGRFVYWRTSLKNIYWFEKIAQL